jgi:hypothetical protein
VSSGRDWLVPHHIWVISEDQMRSVCGMAASLADTEKEEEFLFALRAACGQYLRERVVFLAYCPICSPKQPSTVVRL